MPKPDRNPRYPFFSKQRVARTGLLLIAIGIILTLNALRLGAWVGMVRKVSFFLFAFGGGIFFIGISHVLPDEFDTEDGIEDENLVNPLRTRSQRGGRPSRQMAHLFAVLLLGFSAIISTGLLLENGWPLWYLALAILPAAIAMLLLLLSVVRFLPDDPDPVKRARRANTPGYSRFFGFLTRPFRTLPSARYCIRCGAGLQKQFHLCPRCGYDSSLELKPGELPAEGDTV